MGRIGVDIYPLQVGVSLREVETFGKYLGGSATNVAVAAARYGRRSAVITRTGADPFGEFLHDALRGFGVDDRFVTAGARTCRPRSRSARSSRPTTSRSTSTACPTAPDLEIRAERARPRRDPGRRRLLGHRSPACRQEPSRAATLARAAGPRASRASPSSTSTTGRCSGRPGRRRGAGCEQALPLRHRRRRQPRRVRHRGRRPGAARRGPGAARRGRRARRRQAGAGRRARLATAATEVEVPPVPVEVVNGLGAGDAFGGALCHGLLAGWDLERAMRFCNAAGAIVAVPAGLRRRHAHRPTRSRPSCGRPSVRESQLPSSSSTRARRPGARSPRRAAGRRAPAVVAAASTAG